MEKSLPVAIIGTLDFDNLALTRQLNVRGVIRDVHQRGVNHLVVDGVLRGTAHSTGPGIEIVDEQGRQLTLLDDVGRLADNVDEPTWPAHRRYRIPIHQQT